VLHEGQQQLLGRVGDAHPALFTLRRCTMLSELVLHVSTLKGLLSPFPHILCECNVAGTSTCKSVCVLLQLGHYTQHESKR
jgi:hypothetical protein